MDGVPKVVDTRPERKALNSVPLETDKPPVGSDVPATETWGTLLQNLEIQTCARCARPWAG